MAMPIRWTPVSSNYAKNQSLAIGKGIYEYISAGGLTWTIGCYPHGSHEHLSDNGEYLSLRVWRKMDSIVKGIFHAFVMGRDGAPSVCHPNTSSLFTYISADNKSWVIGGWYKFMKRSELESDYLIDGCITFMCGITILPEDRISVPASDLGNHLGNLLDCTDGSDVSFSVGGETFLAHRAVLDARSPAFKAQLLGSMADANLDRIILHDIQPATFQALLRFMYTDALPADDELDSICSTIELLQHLLAAADMYHMDRLKLMCAQMLCDRVSVENVATICWVVLKDTTARS
ncbi:hypothetical protein EJB05_48164, partial [Eragrostis curvula]